MLIHSLALEEKGKRQDSWRVNFFPDFSIAQIWNSSVWCTVPAFQPNLVANCVTQRFSPFIRNPLTHTDCSNSPRLCYNYSNGFTLFCSIFNDVLRHLCCFPTTCLPNDDCRSIFRNGIQDSRSVLEYLKCKKRWKCRTITTTRVPGVTDANSIRMDQHSACRPLWEHEPRLLISDQASKFQQHHLNCWTIPEASVIIAACPCSTVDTDAANLLLRSTNVVATRNPHTIATFQINPSLLHFVCIQWDIFYFFRYKISLSVGWHSLFSDYTKTYPVDFEINP